MKRKKKNNDFTNWRKEKKNIIAVFEDNKKLLMPIILGIAVIITVVIALSANRRAVKQSGTDENVTPEHIYEITDAAMEENEDPEIRKLIDTYYKACADGDVEAVKSIYKGLDDTEILKSVAASKYVEEFRNIKVYTKPGPVEGSFLAYVYNEVKLYEYDKLLPGLDSMYIRTSDDGSYYFNGDVADNAELQYIKKMNVQADVIDLNNKVASQYNEMVKSDEALAEYLDKMSKDLQISVGEALASAEAASTMQESATEATTEEQEEKPQTVTTYTIRATDVINIRSSDSETAEVIDKTERGQEFKQLEALANGWSKIEYKGKTAYVKTEFFEVVGEETVEVPTGETAQEEPKEAEDTTENKAEEDKDAKTADADKADADKNKDTADNNTADSGKSVSAGKHQVKDTVRFRKGQSTDSESLGNIYKGDTVNVVESYADGWTKIEYNKKTGYIKTEFISD